jgi:large subunit ribosomal protein L19
MKAKGFTKETIRNMGLAERTLPKFSIGDTIAISQRIREGDKERLQVFQGDVLAMHNNGASGTFTVRKIGANSIAVERIYPFNSPLIDSIKIVRKGDVRRAKLYYIRDRIGKSARVQELVQTKEEKLARIKKENNKEHASIQEKQNKKEVVEEENTKDAE